MGALAIKVHHGLAGMRGGQSVAMIPHGRLVVPVGERRPDHSPATRDLIGEYPSDHPAVYQYPGLYGYGEFI
jgi:hypothetical protein